MRCTTALTVYAKERSGILAIEEAVKSTVSPIYDKFHLLPDELLRYAHCKPNRSASTAHPPRLAASNIARRVYSKCKPAAKELYDRYEPKVEQCAVSTWRQLNRLPLFPRVADAVLPKATYCTEKYNKTVVAAEQKGYRVSAYLPLVHTERIAKVFYEKDA